MHREPGILRMLLMDTGLKVWKCLDYLMIAWRFIYSDLWKQLLFTPELVWSVATFNLYKPQMITIERTKAIT